MDHLVDIESILISYCSFDKARRGLARPGQARQGMARQGYFICFRCGEAVRGAARPGLVGRGEAGHGEAWQGTARQGYFICLNVAGRG
jgi:hypothetical protein